MTPAALPLLTLPRGYDKIPVIVGPTASGKTQLALEFAERNHGEIVGVDSIQVYRHFDLGSGKPTVEERQRVPHHGIDVADAQQPLDAGMAAGLAWNALVDITSRGRLPVLCGGTFLWVRAVLYGLADSAPQSAELRAQHRQWVEAEGALALHERLRAVDAVSAARWSPNDVMRTSRALEVFTLTGRPLSELHAAHGFTQPRVPFRLIGVQRSTEELRARIAARTQAWLAAGWRDEVNHLVTLGYEHTRPMQSVGYKHVLASVRGELAEADLATAIERATWVLVRRQRTWLRDESVTWLAPSQPLTSDGW